MKQSLPPAELDTVYTALANGTDAVGDANVALFLATVALALAAQQPDCSRVLAAIEQAQRLAMRPASAPDMTAKPSAV